MAQQQNYGVKLLAKLVTVLAVALTLLQLKTEVEVKNSNDSTESNSKISSFLKKINPLTRRCM